ncbi:LPXTG cell wall anchor domain-containing protein [Tardiphaga robiniae]|nr:LPXTG cell wall anchor domain-containing protein [Tardiphaga robiniae]NUU41411.1 LPXTG cell wall anchor domain-containing protein [Tardiphaga robiniae]
MTDAQFNDLMLIIAIVLMLGSLGLYFLKR